MSIELEFCSLIIPIDVIRNYYPGGFKKYKSDHSHIIVPKNFNVWFDEDLVREGSMGQDFDDMIQFWEKLGVKTNKNDKTWKHPCVVVFTDPDFCKQLVFRETPMTVSLRGKPDKTNILRRNKMRKLSTEFMADLKAGGILSPLREAVKKDKDIILEIRNDSIDIYYRGGRILDLKRQENEYTAEFDIAYAKNHPKQIEVEKILKKNKITTQNDASKWVDNIRYFKEIMDFHFNNSKNETLEKNIQQLIVQENNLLERISNATDYFIVDFEYQVNFKYQLKEKVETRFDLVGLFWDRKDRKNPKGCKLAIIEVKYGDDSLTKEDSGLTAHIIKTEKFLDDKERVKKFKEEMITVFKQKRELDLLEIKSPHEVPINEEISIEYMVIIAGHSPGSGRLGEGLDKMEKELDKPGSKLNQNNVRFAVSSFFGYTLFKENMKSFSEFRELLKLNNMK